MKEEKRAQIILLDRWRKNFEMLTAEQAKQIINAMYNYQFDGIEPEFTDTLVIFFWQDVKQWLDDSNKRYKVKCDKNRDNIQGFWDKKQKADTDEYERIQTNTTATNDNDNDNDNPIPNDIPNDNAIDKEKEKENQISVSDSGAGTETDTDKPKFFFKVLGDYYEKLFYRRPLCHYTQWKKYAKHFGGIEEVKHLMNEIKDIAGESAEAESIIEKVYNKYYRYAIDEAIKKWREKHYANKQDVMTLTVLATLYHWKDISEAIDKTNDNGGKYVSYLKQVLKNDYEIADSEYHGRDNDKTGSEEDDRWERWES